MPEFPIHYYRHILAKYWTHGKMTSFLPFVLVKILDSPWKYWTVGRYVLSVFFCFLCLINASFFSFLENFTPQCIYYK